MTMLLFHRKSNNFDDIRKDAKANKLYTTISCDTYLFLDFAEKQSAIQSFFMLKYNDDIVPLTTFILDRSPIEYKDYIPKK